MKLWNMTLVWFGFSVQWHINFQGLFNANTNLVGQEWYYLTHSLGIREFIPFPDVLVEKL